MRHLRGIYEVGRVASAGWLMTVLDPLLAHHLPAVISQITSATLSAFLVILISNLLFSRPSIAVTWTDLSLGTEAPGPTIDVPVSHDRELANFKVSVEARATTWLSKRFLAVATKAGAVLHLRLSPELGIILTPEWLPPYWSTNGQSLELEIRSQRNPGEWGVVEFAMERSGNTSRALRLQTSLHLARSADPTRARYRYIRRDMPVTQIRLTTPGSNP